MKQIVFTVTNDLIFDQRMQRICTSLSKAGYNILLIGRKLTDSLPLKQQMFQQKRLLCRFKKTAFFYAEYNIRLFCFLLFIKMDVICAIDLDTILPCYFVSQLRRKKRVYDAHELFTEMKEVITRPQIQKQWRRVEQFAVPKFKYGYTVSYSIAEEFDKRYNVNYAVIRNLPRKKMLQSIPQQQQKIFLYQGAVNEARGLENLIIAMKEVNAQLHIYGDGNMLTAIKNLINKNSLQHKIVLKGKALPEKLDQITPEYYAGINLVEPLGLNQIYSLANKFFDYMQAGIPQLTMNFPEYKKVNDEYEIAVLINTVQQEEIAAALKLLLNDVVYYKKLTENCIQAKEVFNWGKEEKKLVDFYRRLITD